MHRILPLALCLLLLSGLSGCHRDKVYRIGISQCSQDDWRTKMNDEINREIMLHKDAVVEIRSADDSSARQIDDIRYFVQNGFDILIVSPNEAAALTPVIDEVYKAGIPVVIFDRNINSRSYTARIGADDEGTGRAAARYAMHLLGGKARAIEISGLRGSTPAAARHRGFVRELESAGGTLLASAPGNWNKEDAVPVVDSLLSIHPETNLIYAHNDRMAIGASEVARRLGRDDIKIIGIDAAPDIGIRAVADGIIDATFLYPTEGHRLVRTALAILKHEPYERETILPVSSAVDRSNADILLRQNEMLKEETRKIELLKTRIDLFQAEYSAEKSLLYAGIAIILLLCGVGFLLLRAWWQHSRHQKELMQQNRLLEEERQRTVMEPLRGVYFSALESRLKNTRSIFSTSTASGRDCPAAGASSSSLMPRLQATAWNDSIHSRMHWLKSTSKRWTSSLPFSYLRKSSIWSIRRRSIRTFFSAIFMRVCCCGVRLSAAASCATGSEMSVSGVRRSCDTLVKNISLDWVAFSSCSLSRFCLSRCDARQLTFEVADTGEGISEHDIGNIFDRFYQADRIHPRGSGIGLSLAKAFVELHGGTISVESQLHKGARFTVTLPVRHVAPATTETGAEDVDSATGQHNVEAEFETIDDHTSFDADKPIILVIDDNRDIRLLIKELMSADYNILTASNGREGVRLAARYVPDLVICDVMMPVMDGLECCRRIKNELSTSHIPVLMLTACSMDEQRAQGYDSGADGYLSKPFSSAVLKSRCASLIANRKRIRELWSSSLPAGGRKQERPTPGPNAPAGDPDNEFYNRFLALFQEEMGNANLSIDSIAARMGLERSQFYRKIKSLTNYAPVELIRLLRLQRGRTLLTTTDKSISEIAYETGFSAPSYFTKCYRDVYGETPTDVRNRVAK